MAAVRSLTMSDGATVSYHDWGSADSDPVVLVQGLGASARGWALQHGPFARRHRVIALDNRGTGRSSIPEEGFSLFDMADDVVAVMDDAGVDRAHVVGVSMGGIVAQILGVMHASRVSTLTLACTACRHADWRRDVLSDAASAVRARGIGALADEVLPWLVGPRVRRRFGLWLDVFARVLLQGDPEGFIRQVEAVLAMPDDFRWQLERVTAPTLVLAGSQDLLTPVGDSEEIVEMVEHAEFTVISGAAHGAMAEAPHAFNRAVLEFLGRAEASVATA